MQIRGLALLLATSGAVWAASPVAGDWIGTLKPGPAELRVLLHVKDADGKLTATMDSLDQGAKGIPIDTITFKEGTLAFGSSAVKGEYEGKLSGAAGAERIAGTWTQMGNSLPLEFERYVEKPKPPRTGPPAKPSDIDGAWEGNLNVPGGQTLRLVFNIKTDEDGELTATLDSPDQNGYGIPVQTVKREGKSIKLEMKGIGARYSGTINDEKTRIEGTFTQGSDMPLALNRQSK